MFIWAEIQNIEIGHFFQSRTFFHLSSNVHTSCLSAFNDRIRDEKLQYDINRQASAFTGISALSSNKIGKHEHLTDEEILPSNQKQIIEQSKFTYSPLGKALEEQLKAIDQGEKQFDASKD